MSLTDAEVASLLANEQKRIRNDIDWTENEDHSPAWEFRSEVESDQDWPLFVSGRYNRRAGALSYALILKTVGRIYGLDMGKGNPQCDQVGDTHVHRWSERYGDEEAHVPDVTASGGDPVAVWNQFCAETCIRHDGTMRSLPLDQGELW